MTADYFNFKKFLDNISNKIINNIKGINRGSLKCHKDTKVGKLEYE